MIFSSLAIFIDVYRLLAFPSFISLLTWFFGHCRFCFLFSCLFLWFHSGQWYCLSCPCPVFKWLLYFNNIIKIATWNLCLGLKNKKDYVSKILNEHKIDIVCLQETEIEQSYPIDILSIKGYEFLTENNSNKTACTFIQHKYANSLTNICPRFIHLSKYVPFGNATYFPFEFWNYIYFFMLLPSMVDLLSH